MIRSCLVPAVLAALVCACAPGSVEDAPAPQEETPAGATTADAADIALPEDATGFITANPLPLAEGEVRRDDYGRPFEYALLGEKLPHITGTMMDGTAFDSENLDKWTVIDVWGIWCGDCMADAPYVAALSTAIDQDPDLEFLSIHTPASAARTTPAEMYKKYGSLDAYFAEKGYSYPVLVDTDASIREALKIAWTPSYLLVSPEGVVKGYRSEFSAAKGEPIKDFMKDIARVKAESKKTSLDTLQIGPGGIGNLRPSTPFTLDAIEAAFPGLEVISTRMNLTGRDSPAFEVREAGEPLLTITPDWTLGRVERVSVTSPRIAGPLGEHIGSFSWNELPAADVAECTENPAGTAETTRVCSDGADMRFMRVFRGDTLTGLVYVYGTPHPGE